MIITHSTKHSVEQPSTIWYTHSLIPEGKLMEVQGWIGVREMDRMFYFYTMTDSYHEFWTDIIAEASAVHNLLPANATLVLTQE